MHLHVSLCLPYYAQSVCRYLYCLHYYFWFQLLLRVVAILSTASAFNVYVLLPAAILVVIFLAMRWYYLKTSRDVKRLEAIGNASLITCYNYNHWLAGAFKPLNDVVIFMIMADP